MKLKLPNSIIGNGRILASLSEYGQLMSFSFPNLDYAQNLGEHLFGIYYGQAGKGHFSWIGPGEWTATQAYLPQSNIVVTKLFCKKTYLALELHSYVLPNRDIIVQHATLRNEGEWVLNGTFYIYLQLNAGEFQRKNTAVYDEKLDAILQWRKDNWFAIGAHRPSSQNQCGKMDDPISAKDDVEDGDLKGYPNMFGHINLALGWPLECIQPGHSHNLAIYIACGQSHDVVTEGLTYSRRAGEQLLREETLQYWQDFLRTAKSITLEPALADIYIRSYLGLKLLFDKTHGAFIAGDLYYEAPGGGADYAYVWHRDVSEIGLSLLQAGQLDIVKRLIDFCIRTQAEDGSWFHRYWTNGDKGPSWCALYRKSQYDQVASPIFLMGEYLKALPDDARELSLAEIWPYLQKGADFLYEQIDDITGLHKPCTDLWEERVGQYSYTSGAFFAGLKTAADIARLLDKDDLAKKWSDVAARIHQAVLDSLWLRGEGYFARGLGDSTPDASSLGLIDPFRLLNLNNETERTQAFLCIHELIRRIGHPSQQCDGCGVIRYPDDRYCGFENPWILCTLWVARASLRVADAFITCFDLQNSEKLLQQAHACLKWASVHTTNTGLLPEQVSLDTEEPAWVVPLAWSMSSFIYTSILFDSVQKRFSEAQRLGRVILYKDKLPEEEYAVLCQLHEHGAMNARDLSRCTSIPYSRINEILFELTQNDLVSVSGRTPKLYASKVFTSFTNAFGCG